MSCPAIIPRRAAAAVVALLALALLQAACTRPGEVQPPQVVLEDVRPLGGGLLAQRVALDLRLTNPNDFDLPLDGLSADLAINGARFAQGVSDSSVTLPRLGSRTVSLEASVSTLDLARQMFQAGQARQLDYSLDGTAYLGRSVAPRSVPLRAAGSFDVRPRSDGERNQLVPITE